VVCLRQQNLYWQEFNKIEEWEKCFVSVLELLKVIQLQVTTIFGQDEIKRRCRWKASEMIDIAICCRVKL